MFLKILNFFLFHNYVNILYIYVYIFIYIYIIKYIYYIIYIIYITFNIYIYILTKFTI